MAKLLESFTLGAEQIRSAVYGLKANLQNERELYRERLHQSLVEALHDPGLWKKAKWR
jgi:hypothetical protein